MKRLPLTFEELRGTNVARCIDGFKHELDDWSPAEWTNAVCGESGEAANIAKKLLRMRDGLAGNTGEDLDPAVLFKKLALELADIVIYADLCAAAVGIRLEDAIIEKFNLVSERIGSPEKL